MKIISNYKDYYDGVQSYGQDDIKYIREEHIYKMRKEAATFPSLDYKQTKEFAKIEFVNSCLIGFCGKFYKAYTIRVYERKIDITLGKYELDVLYNQQELDFYNINKERLFLNREAKLFEVENREYLHELFFKYKTPCYVIKHLNRTRDQDKLIINPNLKKYKFYKIKDAFTAYQEISMFIGGTLAVPFKPIFEISDKAKIQSHGFDKWSFKKLPTKRRK